MTDKVKVAIPLLPRLPGVYLMHDKDDKIIYVGKAKNLYNRVSQYFLRPQAGKVASMVFNVEYFETIITKTEKEAFILEMNLIHKYYPRYNIMLKDGKHYPYIALKKNNDPHLKLTHDEKDKNYYYFGPFPTSGYAREVINLLNKLFPTRKCEHIPTHVCIYYHMDGYCLAPCVNKIDQQVSKELCEQIKSFLNGNTEEISSKLKAKMLDYSEQLKFEQAAEIKQTLDAIKHVTSKQSVESKDKTARDIFGYTTREQYLSLAVLTFRNGILLGKEAFVVEQFGEINEQISDLILQYYQTHQLPKEIIVNIPSVAKEISETYDVNCQVVTKGKSLETVDIATLNARQELDSHFMSARLTDDNLSLLEELGQILNIKTPLRIELFDNSHIQGDSAVGAMVVFQNGEPAKNMYRKYNLSNKENRDDLASMKEIVKRRYSRLMNENDSLPDLILVDGGLTQIKAASDILDEIHCGVPLFGLYKDDKHQTKGLMDKDGNEYLITNKNLFFLLFRMQDEVHRFAISFHHQKRAKNFKVSLLDNIEGLGPKRKQLILEHYQNIDALKQVTVEELEQLVPHKVALLIKQRIDEIKEH